MATYPDISKGEGLTRMAELYSILLDDLETSIDYYYKGKKSQYFRRSFSRCLFSYIESVIQILKHELDHDLRLGHINNNLTLKEKDILYERKVSDGNEMPWNIPLEINLKKTISIVRKYWNISSCNLDASSEEYKYFLFVKRTRNKLTHPKKYYHIEIDVDEMDKMIIVYNWLKKGFYSIIKERINIISETIINKDKVITADDFCKKFRILTLEEYCQ